MTPVEEWRAVAEFAGLYEVSNLGRVRSIDRRVPAGPGRTRMTRGRVLSVQNDRYSHLAIKIDGEYHNRYVHRLVADAFLGPCPNGMEVCHNDGDPFNNRVENLRYDTHSENQRDIVRLGRHQEAARTHCNKGHEYTADNVMPRRGAGESGRRCRACEAERSKRRWAARKKAA